MYDNKDKTIIDFLEKNARTSFTDIAKSLNISETAIRKRVKKLETEGIILGYKANINYKKLGYLNKVVMGVDTTPKDAVIISENTDIQVSPKAVEVTDEVIPEVTYEDLGGLSEEIKKIDWAIELKKKFGWEVGIEIPIIPGRAEDTITFLDQIKDRADFMNFNELEMSVINAPSLMRKGMTWKNDSTAVKKSEKDALKIIIWCNDNFKGSINFCTASQKNQFQ